MLISTFTISVYSYISYVHDTLAKYSITVGFCKLVKIAAVKVYMFHERFYRLSFILLLSAECRRQLWSVGMIPQRG